MCRWLNNLNFNLFQNTKSSPSNAQFRLNREIKHESCRWRTTGRRPEHAACTSTHPLNHAASHTHCNHSSLSRDSGRAASPAGQGIYGHGSGSNSVK